MKTLPLLLLVLPAWSQVQVKSETAYPVPVEPTAERAAMIPSPSTRIAPQTFAVLEKQFDTDLSRVGGVSDPLDLLGGTRGVYLEGYGAVFTAEASLIITPTISPFRQKITEKDKDSVHQKKLARVQPLRQAMREILTTAAKALDQVPANQQMVFVVRLLYLPWEDTSGLPAQIMIKADRTSAMAGQFQTEVQ